MPKRVRSWARLRVRAEALKGRGAMERRVSRSRSQLRELRKKSRLAPPRPPLVMKSESPMTTRREGRISTPRAAGPPRSAATAMEMGPERSRKGSKRGGESSGSISAHPLVVVMARGMTRGSSAMRGRPGGRERGSTERGR